MFGVTFGGDGEQKIRSRHSHLDLPWQIVVQHFRLWTLYAKIYLANSSSCTA
jgi:hypothetical protein